MPVGFNIYGRWDSWIILPEGSSTYGREPPAMNDPNIPFPQAAERLGVPEATLRYWRHLGIGPRGFKMGRRVFFKASELDRFEREQQAADPSTPQPAA